MFFIENVLMPTPDADGITITKNKLWSNNSGRVASGKYVGDILAIKLTIDITYSRKLTSSEIDIIDTAIHAKTFMNVKVLKPGTTNTYITNLCYVADESYALNKKTNKDAYYNGLSLSFVAQ